MAVRRRAILLSRGRGFYTCTKHVCFLNTMYTTSGHAMKAYLTTTRPTKGPPNHNYIQDDRNSTDNGSVLYYDARSLLLPGSPAPLMSRCALGLTNGTTRSTEPWSRRPFHLQARAADITFHGGEGSYRSPPLRSAAYTRGRAGKSWDPGPHRFSLDVPDMLTCLAVDNGLLLNGSVECAALSCLALTLAAAAVLPPQTAARADSATQ